MLVTGTVPGPVRVAAVDLGASSGRVMVGTVGPGRLELEEVHRFGNGPVGADDGSLHWPFERLWEEVLEGLRRAGPVDGIGVDAWAVDYGLLDADGVLLGAPFCYRDGRTDGAQQKVWSTVPRAELFAVAGLQELPFNTLYQLTVERLLDRAATLLLVPDLLGHRLTGARVAEATNASTTELYDVRERRWSAELVARLELPSDVLPPLVEPGQVVGTLLPDVAARTGLPATTPVVAVGSHDTASAVVGVPFTDPARAAYISSGTWSLVGLELAAPVLTEAARAANFTNEGGVDATIRFLRNVMGLWVLSETLREWGADDLPALLAEAAAAPAFGPVVDVDAPAFLPPGDMVRRIDDACRATGQQPPASRPAYVRCILESLALAYRRSVREAAVLADRTLEVVHVVGGGARNELLCRLTADACGVPVLAGPVEATALGNVLVQARALGVALPDLAAMRALVAETSTVVRYQPTGDAAGWDAAEARLPVRG